MHKIKTIPLKSLKQLSDALGKLFYTQLNVSVVV